MVSAASLHPSVARRLAALPFGAILGAILGVVAGWLAFDHLNVLECWGNPPSRFAFVLAGGLASGTAGVVLAPLTPRAPLTSASILAVVVAYSAVLLPVPVSVVLGRSLDGTGFDYDWLSQAAVSTYAVGLAAPPALLAAALWTAATRWVANGSVRIDLDGMAADGDALRAIRVLGGAASVGVVAFFYLLVTLATSPVNPGD